MHLPRSLLLLSLVAFAGVARAATVLVPDFTDDDPSEGQKLRLMLLRSVGGIPGLTIAPLSKFKKLARIAHLEPGDLGNEQAAQILCKPGKLDGILGGSVEDVGGSRTLHIQFFDPNGQVLYKRDLNIGQGELRVDQADRVARGLTSALNLDDAPARPAASAPSDHAPAGDTAEEREAKERAEGKAARGDAEAGPGAEPAKGQELDEVRSHRWEDPGFGISVGLALRSLSYKLIDNTKPCPGTGCISQFASNVYPGGVIELSTFPLHTNKSDFLAGIGVIADFSYASISVGGSTSGGAGFSTTDLRYGADLVYRLRLGFLEGDAAIYSPSIGLRVGLSGWQFTPGTNTFNVFPTSRLAPKIGGELLEPFGHYLRLVLGGDVYVTPYPGTTNETDVQTETGSTSALATFASGFGLHAELEGHFASPISSGLTAHLKVAYESFSDCYETDALGCHFSGSQTYFDFDALIGYAFY